MTLLELLIAISIMTMIVAGLGVMAHGIQQAYEYTEGYGTATQHARVALDRITKTVSEALANEQFPGFIVVAETEGAWRFPETLVVWHPTGSAADPAGLPRFNELVIYCPDANSPNKLDEITVPSDTRTVPPVSNQTQWATEVQAIKKNSSAQIVALTTLLRTCTSSVGISPKLRGAVRFESRLHPADDQWAQYKAGTLAWNSLYWVQGMYGSQTGLRQAWLRMELQLIPGAQWVASDPRGQRAVPFFGSAAVYYQVHR